MTGLEIAGLAAGAAQLFGAGAGAIAQGKLNKKNRAWQEDMYWKQLEQSRNDWHRVNEYNHPSQQMQRLREAGLNPNLLYGQGVKGATGSAGDVSGVSVGNPQTSAPDWGSVGDASAGAIGNYLAVRTNQQNLAESRARVSAIQQKESLDYYKTLGQAINNKRMDFDLGFKQEMKDTVKLKMQSDAEYIRAGIKLRELGYDLQKAQGEREVRREFRDIALSNASLREKAARTALLYAQTANEPIRGLQLWEAVKSGQLDNSLKEWEAAFRRDTGFKGGEGAVPALIRLGGNMWNKVKGYIGSKTAGGFFHQD